MSPSFSNKFVLFCVVEFLLAGTSNQQAPGTGAGTAVVAALVFRRACCCTGAAKEADEGQNAALEEAHFGNSHTLSLFGGSFSDTRGDDGFNFSDESSVPQGTDLAEKSNLGTEDIGGKAKKEEEPSPSDDDASWVPSPVTDSEREFNVKQKLAIDSKKKKGMGKAGLGKQKKEGSAATPKTGTTGSSTISKAPARNVVIEDSRMKTFGSTTAEGAENMLLVQKQIEAEIEARKKKGSGQDLGIAQKRAMPKGSSGSVEDEMAEVLHEVEDVSNRLSGRSSKTESDHTLDQEDEELTKSEEEDEEDITETAPASEGLANKLGGKKASTKDAGKGPVKKVESVEEDAGLFGAWRANPQYLGQLLQRRVFVKIGRDFAVRGAFMGSAEQLRLEAARQIVSVVDEFMCTLAAEDSSKTPLRTGLLEVVARHGRDFVRKGLASWYLPLKQLFAGLQEDESSTTSASLGAGEKDEDGSDVEDSEGNANSLWGRHLAERLKVLSQARIRTEIQFDWERLCSATRFENDVLKPLQEEQSHRSDEGVLHPLSAERKLANLLWGTSDTRRKEGEEVMLSRKERVAAKQASLKERDSEEELGADLASKRVRHLAGLFFGKQVVSSSRNSEGIKPEDVVSRLKLDTLEGLYAFVLDTVDSSIPTELLYALFVREYGTRGKPFTFCDLVINRVLRPVLNVLTRLNGALAAAGGLRASDSKSRPTLNQRQTSLTHLFQMLIAEVAYWEMHPGLKCNMEERESETPSQPDADFGASLLTAEELAAGEGGVTGLLAVMALDALGNLGKIFVHYAPPVVVKLGQKGEEPVNDELASFLWTDSLWSAVSGKPWPVMRTVEASYNLGATMWGGRESETPADRLRGMRGLALTQAGYDADGMEAESGGFEDGEIQPLVEQAAPFLLLRRFSQQLWDLGQELRKKGLDPRLSALRTQKKPSATQVLHGSVRSFFGSDEVRGFFGGNASFWTGVMARFFGRMV